MKKHLYILPLVMVAGFSFGQTNFSLGNAQAPNAAGNSNANASINVSNGNDNEAQSNIQQQQQVFSNVNPAALDNNIGIPQQDVQSTPVNDPPAKDKGLSFELPKPSFNGGSSSRSSGRRHSNSMSKKLGKLNRRMSYVFSKKTKRSFHVDTCFAWAK